MDDSDSWADQIKFPPWIADERDGAIFRNLPAIRFKQSFDAVEGRPDADPATDVHSPFHADRNGETNRDNPHGR